MTSPAAALAALLSQRSRMPAVAQQPGVARQLNVPANANMGERPGPAYAANPNVYTPPTQVVPGGAGNAGAATPLGAVPLGVGNVALRKPPDYGGQFLGGLSRGSMPMARYRPTV